MSECEFSDLEKRIIDGVLSRKAIDLIYHVLSFDDYKAYKDYANELNWRRPRGRKISYRRLTRMQKRQAVLNAVLKAGDI